MKGDFEMKIAMDARSITWYHGTGIGTYTENLLKHLLNIDSENNYNLYWSGDNFEDYRKDNTKIIMTSKKHQRFFQVNYFPSNLKKENIDLYHVPQNGIGLYKDIECKTVCTIHDLIPYIMPETVGRGYLLKFLKEMPDIISNSTGILTVSQYSKDDILRYFPIDPDKIFVTPLAANKCYKPLDKELCKRFILNKYNIKDPFILYLGGFSDRKNVDSLIKAFSKVYKDLDKEHKLVILGSYRDSSQKLVKLVDDLNMEDKIIFAGFIPNEDLPSFYNACEAFVYPSLYEGFGLPPLEAMSCKAPVISSNLTSIPEVVGDCGILIDPYKPDSLRDAMGTLLNDDDLKDTLAIKGYLHSKNYSWENTAKKTLEAYEKIYEL